MSDINEIESMHPDVYMASVKLAAAWLADDGGQQLIAAEIAACFEGIKTICIPYDCPYLEAHLRGIHQKVIRKAPVGCGGMYWGTPTVVDDVALFSKSVRTGEPPELWTKENERASSKLYTAMAETSGTVKRIVTGLGTGDISVDERLEDMGGGRIVAYKRFSGFEDWVLVRDLVTLPAAAVEDEDDPAD